MKKTKLVLSVLVLLCIFLLTSCGRGDYGKAFDSQNKLAEFLGEKEITPLYPSYFPGSDLKGAKKHFVAHRDTTSGKYSGYKIYCFSEPFKTAVYSYNYQAESILSDIPARMTEAGSLPIDNGTLTYYTGTEHKDALFIIGYLNIDGSHYEVRIMGNDKLVEEEYVNYIYPNTELYNKALSELRKLAESLS